jgi:hypothetical protein
MTARQLFDEVVARGIAEARRLAIPVYTFALYHDHESHAVSACIDTADSSALLVRSTNAYNAKYFRRSIEEGDLAGAAMWNANIGRSLSLGDFAAVNVGRAKSRHVEDDPSFYLHMVQALIAAESDILACSQEPERVLFVCSTENDEAGLWWAPLGASSGG